PEEKKASTLIRRKRSRNSFNSILGVFERGSSFASHDLPLILNQLTRHCMNKRSFLNLTSKECLDVYRKVLNNGDSLLHSSHLMSEVNKYGLAISLSILGIEEW